MRRVLVLNANARPGLVAVRSLGKRGLAVTAGSESRFNAGSFSKYTSRRVRYPSPTADPDGFLTAIERELVSREYDMLLPISQVSVETIVQHRERFEPHTTIPFLPYEALYVGLDKRKTIMAARAAGVSCPKSVVSASPDLDEAAAKLGYPVVVKPCHGSSRSGVSVCHTRDGLEHAYRRTTDQHGPVVLQEFIPHGGERGVYTLYNDAMQLARVTVQHRLRSKPPEGGASTYRETVADSSLVSEADRMLSSLDWKGVAMAEFRIDDRTGEPVLMEINPRLWGSLALSVFAGVDFPYHLYQLATDEHVEIDLDYAVGVRARCVFTDAMQVFARSDPFRAATEFVQLSPQPCRFDVLSFDDPLPTVGQLLYYAGRLQRLLWPNQSEENSFVSETDSTKRETNR